MAVQHIELLFKLLNDSIHFMIDDNKIESKHDGRIDDYDYVCIL